MTPVRSQAQPMPGSRPKIPGEPSSADSSVAPGKHKGAFRIELEPKWLE
eukprot:CAMPEP_0177190564 /NCGR_PEP_ID=MMETSP0367-20130122/20893_1 /TAXON_ID=447022 ORGANISM="Scrippsiella hangoei-like, Strain SHHI-4" /NCGR_SAMPLE_ID=MMETSP0367 /ASSEMBLY_ACC=CAM_ASM_000362 /LENGTH=48 /DNA_ID= /DNA_START= /DNA_END= /DNA_ORIENTATION=